MRTRETGTSSAVAHYGASPRGGGFVERTKITSRDFSRCVDVPLRELQRRPSLSSPMRTHGKPPTPLGQQECWRGVRRFQLPNSAPFTRGAPTPRLRRRNTATERGERRTRRVLPPLFLSPSHPQLTHPAILRAAIKAKP